MTKKLYEIAAEIVQAQASVGEISTSEITEGLKNVFVTLQKMKMAEEGGFLLDTGEPIEKETETIDPKASIQEDKVICLECHAEMRQLTVRHLSAHGLSIREYKKKYGFPQRQPLSAKSLSRARSLTAKERGLPEKLTAFQAQRRQEKAAAMMEETTMATANVPADVPSVPEPEVTKTKSPAKKSKKPAKRKKAE